MPTPYIHIIDRSNLDEVVCIIPVGHKDNHTDKAIRVTRREDLERSKFICRSDIVLVNATNSGKEYAIYVSELGELVGDTIVLDFLTPDQLETVQAIAIRMAHNARVFEPARKLLVSGI